MVYFAVLMGILSAVLLFLYLKQKKEIKNITDQIKELTGVDTNTLVHSTGGSSDKLINAINDMLKDVRRIKYSCKHESHAVRQMMTNISHDMRTPLTSAMGYINMINHSDISEEEKARELEIVERRLARLEELINSFFEFSKIVSGEKAPELCELNMVGVLEEAISHYYDDYCAKERMIEFDCKASRITLSSNRNMLMRVFDNLIGNALKHGCGDLKISVNADERLVVFSNPIENAKIDTTLIFDEFYTTDISRTKGNTGLGLAIAKQFTVMLDGSISAEVAGGEFVITLKF